MIDFSPFEKAVAQLKSAIEDSNPVLFLEHKKTYRLIKGQVPDHDYRVPIGEADIKRPGEDLSVFAYGLMLHYCLDAAQILAAEGVSVDRVGNVRA